MDSWGFGYEPLKHVGGGVVLTFTILVENMVTNNTFQTTAISRSLIDWSCECYQHVVWDRPYNVYSSVVYDSYVGMDRWKPTLSRFTIYSSQHTPPYQFHWNAVVRMFMFLGMYSVTFPSTNRNTTDFTKHVQLWSPKNALLLGVESIKVICGNNQGGGGGGGGGVWGNLLPIGLWMILPNWTSLG